MKRQPKEWGEIFANQISDKGLTPQIDEELVQVNGATKQNNPIKKAWVSTVLPDSHAGPNCEVSSQQDTGIRDVAGPFTGPSSYRVN